MTESIKLMENKANFKCPHCNRERYVKFYYKGTHYCMECMFFLREKDKLNKSKKPRSIKGRLWKAQNEEEQTIL